MPFDEVFKSYAFWLQVFTEPFLSVLDQVLIVILTFSFCGRMKEFRETTCTCVLQSVQVFLIFVFFLTTF